MKEYLQELEKQIAFKKKRIEDEANDLIKHINSEKGINSVWVNSYVKNINSHNIVLAQLEGKADMLKDMNQNDSGVDIAEIIEEMRYSVPNRRLLEVTRNLAVEIHPKEANEVKRVIFLKKRDEGAVTKFVAYNPERDVETYHDETVLIAVKELKLRGQEAVAKL